MALTDWLVRVSRTYLSIVVATAVFFCQSFILA